MKIKVQLKTGANKEVNAFEIKQSITEKCSFAIHKPINSTAQNEYEVTEIKTGCSVWFSTGQRKEVIAMFLEILDYNKLLIEAAVNKRLRESKVEVVEQRELF